MLATSAPSMIDRPFAPPIECVMDLPFPTSTNRLWRGTGKRVVLSAEYRTWKTQAGLAVTANGSWRRRAAMPGHFIATVLLDAARRMTTRSRGRDADNFIKATLDWAQSMALVSDDALCDEVTAADRRH